MDIDASDKNLIFQPVVLPCGRVMHNRLVKVAMYEHLAAFLGGPPNDYHFRLYSKWAKHGWGMIVTGNVAIMSNHLTLGRDMTLPCDIECQEAMQSFTKLAQCMRDIPPSSTPSEDKRSHAKTLTIMQLNHSGRQSSNFIGGRLPFQAPWAPSAVRLRPNDSTFISKLVNSILFQTPKAMTVPDIQKAIDRFVEGAVLAHRTKFDGVQLHVAHGYLLAQFLSPKANVRTDAYSSEKALDIIHTIVQRIRQSTAEDFVISIKLNAADYSNEALSENNSLSKWELRALQHLATMASWKLLDVVEISGGDYEKPDFMMADKSSPRTRRQAFFARFSQQAVRTMDALRESSTHAVPLILLTGGLRTPELLHSALESRHADLLGIGRGSVLRPDLPTMLLRKLEEPQVWDEPFGPEPDLRQPMILDYPPFSWMWRFVPKIRLIGAGVNMAWYIVAMRHMASSNFDIGAETNYLGGLGSVLRMWMWMPYLFYPPRKGLTKIPLFVLLILLALIAILIKLTVIYPAELTLQGPPQSYNIFSRRTYFTSY